MTTCTCERDALSEAVLVRVSIAFTRESEALSKVVLIRASSSRKKAPGAYAKEQQGKQGLDSRTSDDVFFKRKPLAKAA